MGLIFTVISLGGSLTANTESEKDWAYESLGENDEEKTHHSLLLRDNIETCVHC